MASATTSFSPTSATTSRVMVPDDANLAGNVHGGTILKMIEQVGFIAATRFATQSRPASTERVLAVIARLEHMDFFAPMFVGELSRLEARVTFAATRSVEVEVHVWAEKLDGSAPKRLTNQARLWFACMSGEFTAVEVGALEMTAEEREAGEARYAAQKQARGAAAAPDTTPPPEVRQRRSITQHTVAASATSLSMFMNLSDTYGDGSIVSGGALMKQMDNAAGVVAFRHARTNIVTAAIDALDFLAPCRRTSLVHINARLIFTSSRSMEIEVVVESEEVTEQRVVTNVRALFTFVSLSPEGRPLPVAPLQVQGAAEEARFAEGQARYEARKAARRRS